MHGAAAGIHQVFKHYTRLSSQQRIIALRDFYQGWAAAGSSSKGGKPFFLGRMDPAEHCIFFDDHISPEDPKIVVPLVIGRIYMGLDGLQRAYEPTMP